MVQYETKVYAVLINDTGKTFNFNEKTYNTPTRINVVGESQYKYLLNILVGSGITNIRVNVAYTLYKQLSGKPYIPSNAIPKTEYTFEFDNLSTLSLNEIIEQTTSFNYYNVFKGKVFAFNPASNGVVILDNIYYQDDGIQYCVPKNSTVYINTPVSAEGKVRYDIVTLSRNVLDISYGVTEYDTGTIPVDVVNSLDEYLSLAIIATTGVNTGNIKINQSDIIDIRPFFNKHIYYRVNGWDVSGHVNQLNNFNDVIINTPENNQVISGGVNTFTDAPLSISDNEPTPAVGKFWIKDSKLYYCISTISADGLNGTWVDASVGGTSGSSGGPPPSGTYIYYIGGELNTRIVNYDVVNDETYVFNQYPQHSHWRARPDGYYSSTHGYIAGGGNPYYISTREEFKAVDTISKFSFAVDNVNGDIIIGETLNTPRAQSACFQSSSYGYSCGGTESYYNMEPSYIRNVEHIEFSSDVATTLGDTMTHKISQSDGCVYGNTGYIVESDDEVLIKYDMTNDNMNDIYSQFSKDIDFRCTAVSKSTAYIYVIRNTPVKKIDIATDTYSVSSINLIDGTQSLPFSTTTDLHSVAASQKDDLSVGYYAGGLYRPSLGTADKYNPYLYQVDYTTDNYTTSSFDYSEAHLALR